LTDANTIANDSKTEIDTQITAAQTAANAFDDAAQSDLSSQISAAVTAFGQQLSAFTTFISSLSTSDAVSELKGTGKGGGNTGSPSSYTIPSGSIIFISNNTSTGDGWSLWWAKPSGVPQYEGIANWNELGAKLESVPDGSLPAIVLSGHGASNGGVQTKSKVDMDASNLPANVAALIAKKLAPDGKFVILGCAQAAPERAQGMKDLARAIKHTVVGNTGDVSGAKGKGTWKSFSQP
jgi:hypothetical protein